MKPIAKQSNKKAAFTIVELLTVMSIIVILIGLLVPALNMAKRYAKLVTQKNQFHSIEVAMGVFNNEWDGYPDSGALDGSGVSYCGAMKLCEAMMGQDLLGFHPNSRFRSDGMDGSTPPNQLYNLPVPGDLSARRLHLPLENANAYKLNDIYPNVATSTFNGDRFVLCDVYSRVINRDTTSGAKYRIGMPILYYRANTSRTAHDFQNPAGNIYNFLDNDALVLLGMPWDTTSPPAVHPMASAADATIFYQKTRNNKITTIDRPYRADSYILLSAGHDGQYGTDDDVFNFGN